MSFLLKNQWEQVGRYSLLWLDEAIEAAANSGELAGSELQSDQPRRSIRASQNNQLVAAVVLASFSSEYLRIISDATLL